MKIEFEYTLCGGTFIYMILSCLKSISKRRGANNGGVTEPNCFTDLIEIAGLERDYKLSSEDVSTVISKYKHCTLEAPDWMLINRKDYKDSLDELIKTDYASALHSTIVWSSKYLDLITNGDFICKALLEIVYYDETIDKNDKIHANYDGSLVSFNDLFVAEYIHIQAFILGMWHYVICKRNDIPNKTGQKTIDFISDTTGKKKSVRKINDFVGNMNQFKFKSRIMEIEKARIGLRGAFNEPISIIEEEDDERRALLPGKMEMFGISDNSISLPDNAFKEYLENLIDSQKRVKTLLFHNEPRDFESLYICNDIGRLNINSWGTYRSYTDLVTNPTLFEILKISRYLILTGTGGLGKSMMMKHLLFDAAKKYSEYRLIPVLVPLKDYTNKYDNLIDFIYEVFDSYGAEASMEDFKEYLRSGRVLLLLDGLDEIKTNDKSTFEVQLDRFINRYKNNFYIISSRPYVNLLSFNRFTKLALVPFDKPKCLALINKLDLGKDDEQLKLDFLEQLDKHLYYSHKEFAENPLLLTIMLLTYKQKSMIPGEMHKFYAQAYDTLFDEHDNIKPGYKREYKTGLKKDRFSEYFDEFCFLSYQDEKFDLSDEDCKQYFEMLEAVEEDEPLFDWNDFMDDLVDCVCLMYKEGQKYHFIHRSIQEYFCAHYFSRQPDSMLPAIGEFFETSNTRGSDKTFGMLYAMKPKSVEEQIFIPYLKDLFTNPDNELLPPSYEKFIRTIYPVISFDDGDVLYDSETSAASFLYNFIADRKDILAYKGDIYFGCYYDEFISAEYVSYDSDYHVWEGEYGEVECAHGIEETLVTKEEVPAEYLKLFDMPDVCGTSYEFDMNEVLDQEEYYSDVIEEIYKDDFPIRGEFNAMVEYYKKLVSQKTEHKESLHDKLRRKKK